MNTGNPIDLVLPKLRGIRESGTGWTALCPAHTDKKNSLSVGVGDDGRVLMTCHAGCDTRIVLYHLGLTFKDVGPLRTETVPSNGASWLRPLELPPAAAPDDQPPTKARLVKTTRYDVADPPGAVVAVHVRRDFDDGTKAMHWERPDGSMGLGGMRVESLPLFGVHRLGNEPSIIVVEGEKAAQALREVRRPGGRHRDRRERVP